MINTITAGDGIQIDPGNYNNTVVRLASVDLKPGVFNEVTVDSFGRVISGKKIVTVPIVSPVSVVESVAVDQTLIYLAL